MKRSKQTLIAAGLCLAFGATIAQADNISVSQARQLAMQQVQERVNVTPGRLNASGTNLTLAHAEASSVDADAAAYYVFNVGNDNGFVIIAGEDRAVQVLGYSDHGSLDWNKMPTNMRAWLDGYKQQIEFLQANPDVETDVQTATLKANNGGIGPLVKSTWGQEEPYYNQCPTYKNELCVVGCVATAMAQVMNYWNYPEGSDAISSYRTSSNRISVSALPATTFEWDQILDSYCYWNPSRQRAGAAEYTTAQSDAVAKLCRYCGQAVEMDYSPDGSGAYTQNQASAMKEFGYTKTTLYTRSSYWSTNYTTAEWKEMLNTEINAMRPVLYSASCDEGGHAFIVDGLDSDGNYHVNWGWYGYGDGYFPLDAMIVTHRDGSELYFNSYHQMLCNVVPPTYLKVSADTLTVDPNLTFSTLETTVTATGVSVLASDDIKLVFVLTDAEGNEACRSTAVTVSQGTTSLETVSATIVLPEGLEMGKYTLALYAYTDDASDLTAANCPTALGRIVGHLAKFNGVYGLDDLT